MFTPFSRKISPILTFAYFSDGLVKNHQPVMFQRNLWFQDVSKPPSAWSSSRKVVTRLQVFDREQNDSIARHMLRVSQMFGINLANVTGGVLTCALIFFCLKVAEKNGWAVFHFKTLPGKMIQFDSYLSHGLKPRTRLDGTIFGGNLKNQCQIDLNGIGLSRFYVALRRKHSPSGQADCFSTTRWVRIWSTKH